MVNEIYRQIRALIADGTFIGGDPISESELAGRFGVSRTPVREAMRRLEAEGLILRQAYKRAVVVEVDPEEVLHIFTARAALEPIAAGLASVAAAPDFIDDLRAMVSRMDHAIHNNEPDRRSYRELNAHFHRMIWHRGGNAIFADIIHIVSRKPVVSPTFTNWTMEELIRSNRQHGDIVEAIAAQDKDWAEAAMRAHLLSSRATYRRVGTLSAKARLQAQ